MKPVAPVTKYVIEVPARLADCSYSLVGLTRPCKRALGPSQCRAGAAKIDLMTSSPAAHLPFPLAVFRYRATWGELLYALLGLPLGVAGFVFAVVTVSVGAGLGVTFIGLPVLAVTGIGAKLLADVIRRAANSLTGTR